MNILVAIWEVPKTTFRFNNFLEGLTELGKRDIILKVMVNRVKEYRLTQQWDKVHTAESRRVPGVSFRLSSPSGRQHLFLPAVKCGNMHGLLPTKEALSNLGVQGFYRGQVMW